MNGKVLKLYEEGLPIRDFVHVHDVVKANVLALETETDQCEVINVGSGSGVSLRDVAEALCEVVSGSCQIQYTSIFRIGDIFGCYADLTRAAAILGYEPQVGLQEGLRTLIPWIKSHVAIDRSDVMEEELRHKGLLKG